MLTSLQALLRLASLRWLGVFVCALAVLLTAASTSSALEPAQTKTRVWGFDFAEHNSAGLFRAASPRTHLANRSGSAEAASGSLLAARALPAARYIGKGFAQGQLDKHFAKHAAEWGAGNITKPGYLKRAQSLLGRDTGGDILGHVRPNGDVLRYNAATNEFASGAADGTIRTLFRPTDGMAYWLKQVAP